MAAIAWWREAVGMPTDQLGGKGGGLAFLGGLGVPVPEWFAITAEGFEQAVGPDLRDELDAVAAELPADGEVAELETTAAGLRERVIAATQAHPLVDDIAASYRRLAEEVGDAALSVAVRSSAAGEDSVEQSFAGGYDTHLWVGDEAAVQYAVRACWASLFTARAVDYRRRGGVAVGSMAVVVQRMVPARSAGVFMTLNPSNGDRSKILVESVWGLGEPLVQGEVNPDRFLLDKVTGEVLRRDIASKPTRATRAPTGGGITTEDVAPDDVDRPSLDDEDLTAIREVARAAEKGAGSPQDGEFAVDEQGRLAVLQSRPETVWSNTPKKPVMPGQSAMGAVLSTFSGGSSR